MNIPTLFALPQVQNEDFASIVSRQNLPVSSSNINKENMNVGGFTKCLTYQMAMAGGVDRAFAENREENPVSNAPQAAIAASDDLLNQDSVSLVRCLTYQMAMAGGVDRAFAENREENPVSNAPQAAIVASDDLLNQDSVSLVRCLTYQMAMAAEIDRQTIFQRQILRQETKGLLDT